MSRGHSESPLGAIALLLLIGTIWFLVWSWPWWLLSLPVIACIVLAVRPKVRSKVISSFTREDVEPETGRLRRLLMGCLFGLGVFSAVVCIFAVGRDNLAWWLIPLVLLLLAVRLRGLSIGQGRWVLLEKALCSNMVELLLIASTVLALDSLTVWWLQSVSLDELTLDRLTEWDRRVRETHEFLETHAPKLGVLLVLLGVVLALRVAATIRPALAGLSSATTMVLARGTKWVGRVSTLAAVAASLTFLATEEGGAAGRISVVLRDAKQDYEHFQSVLKDRTDRLLRQAVIDKAWKARPKALKVEMVRAAKFQTEREQFEDMRQRAAQSFEIKHEVQANFPMALDIPSGPAAAILTAMDAQAVDAPAASWTAKDLHQAWGEAEALSAETKDGAEEHDDAEEIAKKAFEKLLPVERLFDTSAFVSLMKSHYPVFGEFLDAITSSVSEAWFDQMRGGIVRRITERRAAQPDVSLAPFMLEEVANAAKGARVDLRQFDASWANARDALLEGYGAEIRSASGELEMEAAAKQRDQIRNEGQSAIESGRLLGRVDAAVPFSLQAENSAELESLTAELVRLGMSWPALMEPSGPLQEQLAAISRRIRLDGMDSGGRDDSSPGDSTDSAGGAVVRFDPLPSLDWGSPMEAIAALKSHCDARLVEAVAASRGSRAQSARLRQVMGSRYDAYYSEWQAQVTRRAAAVEARREWQIEENNRRELEGRENERRLEEMRRPAERAEVP